MQVTAAAEAYEDLRLHDALEAVVAIASRGNLYMEQVAPWTAFKKVRPPRVSRKGMFVRPFWLDLVRALLFRWLDKHCYLSTTAQSLPCFAGLGISAVHYMQRYSSL